MKVITSIQELRKEIRQWKQAGQSVGLVPTMGYLHEGHGSLIKASSQQNDHTVVSVFVNPTQFGPTEDLATYPRDPERDQALCQEYGADLIFRPSPEEMYVNPKISLHVRGLNENLCGLSRPIHFDGVCTVVTKLFNIVTPDRAYFGQKDAQQLAIIKKMVEDLNIPVEVIGCPIIRESDGLAKSSRNTYLNPQEREAALCLSQAIFYGRDHIEKGMKSQDLIDGMSRIVQAQPLAKIEYISVVDAFTMENVECVDRPVLVAMAVYIGKTRLIDNFSYDFGI